MRLVLLERAPLFETILDYVSPPFAKPNEPFHMLVSNIDWSDYVGRIAVGKILGGNASVGETVWVIRNADGRRIRAKLTKVFEYSGLGTSEAATATAEAQQAPGLSGSCPAAVCLRWSFLDPGGEVLCEMCLTRTLLLE